MIIPSEEYLLKRPKHIARVLKKEFPEFHAHITNLPGNSTSEKCYRYFHPEATGLCPICGHPVKFNTYILGYHHYCSAKCMRQDPIFMEKSKATNLKKYGHEFPTQSKTIKKVADQGSCVIIGRCADYILRDDPSVISVFIHAPIEARIERAINVYEVEPDKAEDICLKNDKTRANFYNYYSDQKWGMCKTYDLSLDSSLLGIDGCVDQIINFTKLHEAHKGSKI